MRIKVGSRGSPLSRVQVAEVLWEIQKFAPYVLFEPIFIKTRGDKDRVTSLRTLVSDRKNPCSYLRPDLPDGQSAERAGSFKQAVKREREAQQDKDGPKMGADFCDQTLDKTDFFTREVDALILEGRCRIAIHSAKDLPLSLPEGLICLALTKGVDPSDVLVLRKGSTLESLPKNARIATSSIRREESVRAILSDCIIVDIRGTIAERLQWLKEGKAEGLVVAEAALIRLGMTHLNRVRLPGKSAPLQGRLAIIARREDREIAELFSSLDEQ